MNAHHRIKFESKVDKNGPIPDQEKPYYVGLGPCWVWRGAKGSSGYGSFYYGGKSHPAHRVSCEVFGIIIQVGQEVMHRCDNRMCVNPDHLQPGTRKENVQDCIRKLRHLKPSGYVGGCAVLTQEQVIEIREEYAAGRASQNELTARFPVTQAAICNVVNRRTWKHLP